MVQVINTDDIPLQDVSGFEHPTLESSRIVSAHRSSTSGSLQSSQARQHAWRLALSFFIYAQAGMSDGSLGAQLTSIQTNYNLSFTVVSLIFLANVAGWFIASFANIYLMHRFGLWKTLVISSILNIIGASITLASPPFVLFIFALFLNGLGSCIYDASLASYTAQFDDAPAMSLLYAAFGVGALTAPVVVAAMLDAGVSWNKYYYLPLGTAIIDIPLSWLIFKGYQLPERTALQGALQRFMLVIRNPVVWIGGLLVALSLASGEILSSWIVSFMTDIRHGDSTAMRYVVSGFWAGQVVGRLGLAHATTWIGIRIALIAYFIISIAFLAVLQFVDNIQSSAVAVAFVGIFLGPSTPTIISASSKHVPPFLISAAVSSMIAIGLVGSAFGPLIVGFINSAGGLQYLAAIVMGVVGTMLIFWDRAPRTPWKMNRQSEADKATMGNRT